MAKKNCSSCKDGKWQYHECDVCKLVNNDTNHKKSIYCKVCDAWLCPDHNQTNVQALVQRGAAAIIRYFS
jgi:hypothetical protein